MAFFSASVLVLNFLTNSSALEKSDLVNIFIDFLRIHSNASVPDGDGACLFVDFYLYANVAQFTTELTH